jgi:hypothetical protein
MIQIYVGLCIYKFFSTNAIQVEWLYTVNPPPLEHAKEKQRKNGNFIGEGKGVIV